MTGLSLPSDPRLPLFAHGLLKPNELGYHKVAHLVGDHRSASVAPAGPRIRDGLPLLVIGGDGRVDGSLLLPAPGREEHFYIAVSQFESASQYLRQGFHGRGGQRWRHPNESQPSPGKEPGPWFRGP
jgi:hypothetical protein